MTSRSLKPLYMDARRKVAVVPFAKPLILCIENDCVHLDLRKAVLEKDGYNVIGATSYEDALQVLRDAPICCTIADHMLQGKTGIELAKEMKQVKPDVPVVLYSGNIPLLLDGIDVYVNKGETTEAFLKIIRQVVERYCS